MGRCTKGTSQCVLLCTNALIFLVAAGALGVTIYIFFDAVGKSLTHVSLLTVIGIASIALMLFSILGCKAAATPPEKKCSKCMYLTILLVLFLAELVAAGYVFDLGNSLQVAKDKGFDVRDKTDKAAENALVFLHDQLNDLYGEEQCQGGAAEGATVPFSFTQVHDCKTEAIDGAFLTIFKDAKIDSPALFAAYTNCTTDDRMTPGGGTPSEFTQSFCGSETHIVSLAHKYSQYLVWFPVALAILTFVLLVSTICLIAAAQKERRRQIRLLRGEDPFNSRVQMAGP